MISQSEGYLTILKNEGLLETFVKYLYQKQSQSAKSSTSKELIPVEWIELKCSEIKKRALENDVALVSEKTNVTA